MSAVHKPSSGNPAASLHLKRMQVNDVDDVLAIEYSIYPHPWTRGNFLDSLANGYETWILRNEANELTGYFLAMPVVDELHLLNITVRNVLQGQGIGRMLLDKVVAISREKNMRSVLLEVRPSNPRAQSFYERYGFAPIGVRKNYYPAAHNTREDAIVMRMPV